MIGSTLRNQPKTVTGSRGTVRLLIVDAKQTCPGGMIGVAGAGRRSLIVVHKSVRQIQVRVSACAVQAAEEADHVLVVNSPVRRTWIVHLVSMSRVRTLTPWTAGRKEIAS